MREGLEPGNLTYNCAHFILLLRPQLSNQNFIVAVSSGTLIMRAATDQDDENFREIGALLSRNGPGRWS